MLCPPTPMLPPLTSPFMYREGEHCYLPSSASMLAQEQAQVQKESRSASIPKHFALVPIPSLQEQQYDDKKGSPPLLCHPSPNAPPPPSIPPPSPPSPPHSPLGRRLFPSLGVVLHGSRFRSADTFHHQQACWHESRHGSRRRAE